MSEKTSTVSNKATPRMRAAFDKMLERRGTLPFRQSVLEDELYPLTTPRDRERAKAVAQALIRAAAKIGKIERTGHLNWKLVDVTRTLRSKRKVGVSEALVDLSLKTHCAEKWVSVDLETGDVWVGTSKGWRSADAAARAEAAAVLAPKMSRVKRAA